MKIQTIIRTLAIRKYRKSFSIALASLLLAATFPVNGGTSLAKSTSSPLAAPAGSTFVTIIGSSGGGDSFGDEPGSVPGTYRGLQFTYTFNLPGVDPTKHAQVILSTHNLSSNCNRFEINGVQVPNALRDHGDEGEFKTDQSRILSSVGLKETGNTLRIAALNTSCTTGGNEDDFGVANVVIHYIQR